MHKEIVFKGKWKLQEKPLHDIILRISKFVQGRDPGTYKEEKQNEKVFGYECITHSDCSNDLRMQQSKQ